MTAVPVPAIEQRVVVLAWTGTKVLGTVGKTLEIPGRAPWSSRPPSQCVPSHMARQTLGLGWVALLGARACRLLAVSRGARLPTLLPYPRRLAPPAASPFMRTPFPTHLLCYTLWFQAPSSICAPFCALLFMHALIPAHSLSMLSAPCALTSIRVSIPSPSHLCMFNFLPAPLPERLRHRALLFLHARIHARPLSYAATVRSLSYAPPLMGTLVYTHGHC